MLYQTTLLLGDIKGVERRGSPARREVSKNTEIETHKERKKKMET